MAVRAWRFGHAVLDIGAHAGALRFAVTALQVIDDTLKFTTDDAITLIFLIAKLQRFALCPVQDGGQGFL